MALCHEKNAPSGTLVSGLAVVSARLCDRVGDFVVVVIPTGDCIVKKLSSAVNADGTFILHARRVLPRRIMQLSSLVQVRAFPAAFDISTLSFAVVVLLNTFRGRSCCTRSCCQPFDVIVSLW
jgi:hypothetical protein